jgi:hypothetical protein
LNCLRRSPSHITYSDLRPVEPSTMESDPTYLDRDDGISTSSSSSSSSLSSATATVTTSEHSRDEGSGNGKHYSIRASTKNTLENFFSRSSSKDVEPPVNRSQKKVVRLYQQSIVEAYLITITNLSFIEFYSPTVSTL